MSVSTPVLSEPGDVSLTGGHVESRGVTDRVYGALRAIPASFLWIIVLIWTLPTLGLFVSSFRTREAQTSSGWWTVSPERADARQLPHRARVGRPRRR